MQYFTASPIGVIYFSYSPRDRIFPLKPGAMVFLAVKESLHNIVQHSTATVAVTTLRYTGTTIEILIEDNGGDLPTETRSSFGNGLENMTMRLAQDQRESAKCNRHPALADGSAFAFGGSKGRLPHLND